jgi:NAD+ diphosphatase
MNQHFVSTVNSPETLPAKSYWLIFQGASLLVFDDGEKTDLPLLQQPQVLGLTLLRQHYLGYLEDGARIHCIAAEVAGDVAAPAGMVFQGLRGLYGRLSDEHLWLGGRAVQIIEWDRTHVYCGRCGVPNEIQAHERAKKCPQCGLVTYPRISPAIIVRVTRATENGTEILMARGVNYRLGFYSVLAGFVEPGETLETAVRREIKEEVGLEVKNVRYFGSQPWPFPNSLMIAFTAEYASGELVLEEAEIEDAKWCTPETMPSIPPPMSISRALIDDYLERPYPSGHSDGKDGR